MSHKLLDLSGLQRFFNKLKDIIPTKTSELQNDSGYITQSDTVDSTLSSTSEKAVQNKVIKQALDSKANDNSVVHTTGNESVSGTKSFNSDLNLNYSSIDVDDIVDSLPGTGSADTFVHLIGAETINGIKSFPDGIVANVSGTATPLAHTHTTSDITDLSIPSKVSDLTNDSGYITGVSWNDVSGKPSSFTPSSHTHGSITNDGKLGTAANKPLITGANGVITTGSFGTSANTFCQGNDSRLSDARTPLSHTHGNSDITSLDASKITSGTIDIARLPKGALERLVTVADQTARFALTSSDVQLGDTVKQLDTGVMYIVSDDSKLSSADGYTEYTAGSATSVPWSGVTGKPSSYTPSSHTHGNITNDGKLGTASKVLISDSNKKITTSSVSDTELGYLSGVTSAIQTQISGKANASHTHSASDITSGLATVATSGSYNDLSNKPTIPTVNNATLTIQKNGTTVKTFTANASSNVTANITVPTKTSELTNDSGYLTSHQDISGLSAKADTIKSLSISGRTITYTKGDDTTGTLTTQDNNTWTAMVGATSSANGSVGYVNAVPPKDGYNTKYLRADGTWAVPPDHTYTVNNKTLTIQKNGTNVATFTSNSNTDVTANITVPTKTSELTNDSGYLTSHQSLSNYVTLNGAQTISATKTWTASQSFKNTAITNHKANPSADTAIWWQFWSNDNKYWGGIGHNYLTTGVSEMQIAMSNWTTSGSQGYWHLDFGATKDFSSVYFRPSGNNNIYLGTSDKKWANVYATTFTGNLTGNVTGNCSGSSGSCTGNAATATKATNNANGKELSNSIIKGLSISGKTITYTQIDGTTGTITTQDTNTDTLMTQNVSTTNATYPILLCPTADATANQGAKTSIFAKSVKINPSTNVLSATQLWSNSQTIQNSGFTKGTNPSAQSFWSMYMADKNGNDWAANCLGVFETTCDTSGNVTSVMKAVKNEANSSNAGAIAVTYNKSANTVSTYAPTPATSDNSTQIATTAFVKAQGYITSSSNITGTSANVTGTVAIANGGTGATTRLNAVKALTSEDVGTSTQYFLTITSNWGKAGYCSVTDAKTVLGLGTAIFENNTGRDANTVTFNGINYYTSNGPATSLGASTNDGALYSQAWSDKWVAQIAQDYRNGNLFVRGKNNGTWTSWKVVACYGDNVSKFANDAGYLTSHQSLSNYVNLNGDQTITATKRHTANLLLKNTAITNYKAAPSADISNIALVFNSNENRFFGAISHNYFTNGHSVIGFELSNWTTSGNQGWWRLDYGVDKAFSQVYFRPNGDNWCNLGDSSNRWKACYATNFYGALTGNVTGNCSGTSANVTGTVAIANGGTGATSRLNAVKNLTNEDVGTNAQFFLTITTNWGKAGYCSVANAKTVLSVPTKTSQLTNDSGFLTSHQSLSNYVTLNGTQTISGEKTFSKSVKVSVGSSEDSGYSVFANVSRKDVGDGKYYGTYINAGVASGPGVLGVYGYIRNTDGTSELQMRLITSKSDGNFILKALQFQADRYGNTWQFIPSANNTINLGTSSNKWKTAHAVNFYENGTALSSKYVKVESGYAIGTHVFGRIQVKNFPTGTGDSQCIQYGNEVDGSKIESVEFEISTTNTLEYITGGSLSGKWEYLGTRHYAIQYALDRQYIYAMFRRKS